MRLVLLLPAVIVAIAGITLNLVTLSHFLMKERHRFSAKLFIALISFDIGVCTMHPLSMYKVFFLSRCTPGSCLPLKVGNAVYETSMLLSTVSTVFISIMRSINLRYPFYQIKESITFGLLVLFCVFFCAGNITKYIIPIPGKLQFYNNTIFGSLSLILIAISGAVIFITMRKYRLRRHPYTKTTGVYTNYKNTEKAAFTVVVLVFVYCFTNLIAFTGVVLYYLCKMGVVPSMNYVTLYICVSFYTINSAINPLVFMFRHSELRLYIKKLCLKCWTVIRS